MATTFDPSRPSPACPSPLLSLWIAEETSPGALTATLSPAGFETSDPEAALDRADAFNRRELAEPVGAWAVVRVVNAADAADQNAASVGKDGSA